MLTRGCRLQPAPRQRTEAKLLEQGFQARRVHCASFAVSEVTGQGGVAGNRGELSGKQGDVPMRLQLLRMPGAAAQAQEGNLGDTFEQGVERLEMAEQGRGRLRADAGHAGDIVDRIAGQAEVVGDLVGVHAVTRLHAIHAPTFVACVVPLDVAPSQQLRQVLVG